MRKPVIEKIMDIASRIPGVTFMYDDWQQLQVRAERLRKPCEDNEKPCKDQLFPMQGFPLLFVLLQSTGTFNRKFTSNMRDYPDFLIGCVVPMKERSGDWDGLENVARVEWAKAILGRFLNLYEASGMFKPLPDLVNYNDVYKLFSGLTTGVYINVRVEETGGECLPTLPVYTDPIDPNDWVRNCKKFPPEVEPRYELIYSADNQALADRAHITNAGVQEADDIRYLTPFFEILPEDILTTYYTGYQNSGYLAQAFYDEDKNYIMGRSGIDVREDKTPVSFPEGARYVRYGYYRPVDSRPDYFPFIERSFVNVCKPATTLVFGYGDIVSFMPRGFYDNDDNYTFNSAYRNNPLTEIVPNATYYYTGCTTSLNASCFKWYDENQQLIGQERGPAMHVYEYPFQFPAEAKYFKCQWRTLGDLELTYRVNE